MSQQEGRKERGKKGGGKSEERKSEERKREEGKREEAPICSPKRGVGALLMYSKEHPRVCTCHFASLLLIDTFHV